MVLFGSGDDGDGEATMLPDVGAFYPIYPLTKGVESWDLQRAVTFARTVLEDVPEVVPGLRARRLRPGRRPHGVRLDPRAR